MSGESDEAVEARRADPYGSEDTDQLHQSNHEEAGQQVEPGAGEDEDIEHARRPSRYFLIKAEEPPKSASIRLLRHLAIVSIISFAALWGLLAREGLVALNTYSGRSVEPTIWAQAVGCLVMGWAVANRDDLERWYPPAYIAIGTGFCGSLTTFSSWILHVFQAYGNQLHYNRHGLHNVMDALSQTALTIGMSLISLYAGKALKSILPAKPLLHHLERYSTHRAIQRRRTLQNNAKSSEADEAHAKVAPLTEQTRSPYTMIPDLCSIVLGVAFWAGAAILCGTYAPFRHVTYALVLSPPGAILRWYLSRLNSIQRSKQFPYWPLGTLAANLIATAVLSAVFVGQRVGRVSGSPLSLGAHTVDACNALYGVQEGFCGCLSTISTFAVELDTLKPRRRAVSYAVGSYVLGIVICVLIIGSPWWTVGMDGSCVGVTV